eukprot:evm.model.scf_58.12 EVM.evm.TU.scf_58.12   scf_58:110984-115751(+)
MGLCMGKESHGGRLDRHPSSLHSANGSHHYDRPYQPTAQQPPPLPQPKGPDFGLQGAFQPIDALGEGGSGETWLMRERDTGRQVAVKMIRRPIPKVLHEMLLHEIQIQGELGEGHLNVVNAEEVILTRTHLAIVMEYAAGGTLTKYVSDRWDTVHHRGGLFLSEDEARYYFKQFVSAVEYCHGHRVAHRDLKLDNTLLDVSDPPIIKICDFGFAKHYEDNSNMFTQIGTPVYMSPELISSKRGRVGYDGVKADVWASGVMLFVMLLGMFPYEHSEHPDPNTSAAQIEVWLQQIKQKWRENSRVKDAAVRLSPECRDLLDKVFELNEKRRCGVEDIKRHAWFNMPMPPKYEAALKRLEQQQEKVRRVAAAGKSRATVRMRDEQLKDMLSLAARMGNANEDMRRVNLHSQETMRMRKREH